MPPAALIFSSACFENLCARTVSAFEMSPCASTFTCRPLADEAVRDELLRADGRAGLEDLGEARDVDHGVLDAVAGS